MWVKFIYATKPSAITAKPKLYIHAKGYSFLESYARMQLFPPLDWYETGFVCFVPSGVRIKEGND